MKHTRLILAIACLLIGTGIARAQTGYYYWADPGLGGSRDGTGTWSLAGENWTLSSSTDPTAVAAGDGWTTLPTTGRARLESAVSVTLQDNITFTLPGYVSTGGSVYTIASPKDLNGDYLYTMTFYGRSLLTTSDIFTLATSTTFDVPVTVNDGTLYVGHERDRTLTFESPIVGENTGAYFFVRPATTGSVNHAVVYLKADNTYGGQTTIAGAQLGTDPVYDNRLELRLSGSLTNSNIEILNLGLLQGQDADNKGLLNFNLADDTADRINVYQGGILNLTNLDLALNVTGSQAGMEYIIADYSHGDGGTVLGTEFASVTGLDSGWSIEYGGTLANPDSIVLVIPEPGALALLGLGGAALLGMRRRYARFRAKTA